MQRHHCEDRLRLQGWNPYQQQSLLHAPSRLHLQFCRAISPRSPQ
ncbi:Uncharacterised protein [Vibrio cholerae]|nr:Uncharacterised protein [Vibrio cholerae]